MPPFLLSLLAMFRRMGFEIWLSSPGYIWVRPFSKLTPEQMDCLKRNKPLIIREIEQRGEL